MAFETTPQLYPSFDLPPGENPLSDSGRWRAFSVRPPLMVGSGGTSIHGTVEFAVNGSLFQQMAFQGPVVEGYGCAPGAGLGAALESHRIVALSGDPDVYTGFSSGWGGGIGESYFFRKYTNFGFTGIGDNGVADGGLGVGAPGPGMLGIRILSDRVQQWGFNGSYSDEWFLVQTHFESIPQVPWRFALETEEQGGIEEVGWVCFGAGVVNKTKLIRWQREQRTA